MGKKLFFVIALLAVLGIVVDVGLDSVMHGLAEKEIARWVSETPAVERLDYDKLEVGFLGSWFRLNNVLAKIKDLDEKVLIDRVEIPEYTLEKNELTELRLEMDGLKVPSEFFSDASGDLAEAKEGGHYAVADLRLVYDYDPGPRRMEVKDFSVESRALGDATVRLTLENFDPFGISLENPMASVPALVGVSIARAEVSYVERSALKRILREWDGTPSETMRFLTRAVRKEIKRAKQNGASPKVVDTLDKFRRFLEKPEKIRITASPESPVPLGRFVLIRKVADVIDVLNLNVEL